MSKESKDGLIIRINNYDFSIFSGYYNTNSSYTQNNEILNEYIKLYKTNDNIKYLQIECDRNFPMHTIAYICNQIEEKYFIKTDHKEDVKDNKYWLCFYKSKAREEAEAKLKESESKWVSD